MNDLNILGKGARLYVLTTFRAGWILVMLSWIFLVLVELLLCEMGQILISDHYLENAWKGQSLI